jgi:hypothetical protein
MNNSPNFYQYYYWGPLLWRSKISLEVCDELLLRGRALTTPLNHKLASIIDDVKVYDKTEDRKFLVENMIPFLSSYFEFSKTWFPNRALEPLPELELIRCWINFQQANEYNPEHTHDGDFSFVVYLKIPENLKKENNDYIGTSNGPGAITFRYGEDNDWASSSQSFLPEKGDIFIFPAKLAHSVHPFKSDDERISVSGNFRIVK